MVYHKYEQHRYVHKIRRTFVPFKKQRYFYFKRRNTRYYISNLLRSRFFSMRVRWYARRRFTRSMSYYRIGFTHLHNTFKFFNFRKNSQYFQKRRFISRLRIFHKWGIATKLYRPSRRILQIMRYSFLKRGYVGYRFKPGSYCGVHTLACLKFLFKLYKKKRFKAVRKLLNSSSPYWRRKLFFLLKHQLYQVLPQGFKKLRVRMLLLFFNRLLLRQQRIANNMNTRRLQRARRFLAKSWPNKSALYNLYFYALLKRIMLYSHVSKKTRKQRRACKKRRPEIYTMYYVLSKTNLFINFIDPEGRILLSKSAGSLIDRGTGKLYAGKGKRSSDAARELIKYCYSAFMGKIRNIQADAFEVFKAQSNSLKVRPHGMTDFEFWQKKFQIKWMLIVRWRGGFVASHMQRYFDYLKRSWRRTWRERAYIGCVQKRPVFLLGQLSRQGSFSYSIRRRKKNKGRNKTIKGLNLTVGKFHMRSQVVRRFKWARRRVRHYRVLKNRRTLLRVYKRALFVRYGLAKRGIRVPLSTILQFLLPRCLPRYMPLLSRIKKNFTKVNKVLSYNVFSHKVSSLGFKKSYINVGKVLLHRASIESARRVSVGFQKTFIDKNKGLRTLPSNASERAAVGFLRNSRVRKLRKSRVIK